MEHFSFFRAFSPSEGRRIMTLATLKKYSPAEKIFSITERSLQEHLHLVLRGSLRLDCYDGASEKLTNTSGKKLKRGNTAAAKTAKLASLLNRSRTFDVGKTPMSFTGQKSRA